jgi:Flp pilus assembly protein TadD
MRNWKRSRFAVLLPLLLFPVLPAPAQDTANIIGQIRVSGGALPNERLRVTLHTRGMVVGDTYADNEGRFFFYGLPSNVYHVRMDVEGYRPVDQIVTMSTVAITSQHVQINLVPVEKAPVRPPEGPVRGGNPHMVQVAEYLKKYPAEAVKEFEKGVAAEQQGKDELAIRHYLKAVGLEPSFYPARNNLGIRLLGQQKFAEAEEQFEAVIRLSPNDAQGYFNLGNVLALTGRYADAERTLHEGLKFQPDAALGHFLLGYIYLRAGQYEEAEKRLRWSLQLNPALSKARIELANALLQRKNTAAAIEELRRFVADYPQDPLLPQVRKLLAKLEAGSKPGGE